MIKSRLFELCINKKTHSFIHERFRGVPGRSYELASSFLLSNLWSVLLHGQTELFEGTRFELKGHWSLLVRLH